MAWTNPDHQTSGTKITDDIYNAIMDDLLMLASHTHLLGIAGDGALVPPLSSGITAVHVPAITGVGATTSAAAVVTVNNEVRFMRFYLPLRMRLASFTFFITTPQAGSTGGIGVYNADGTVLLASGTISTAVGNARRIALGATVDLAPGFYILGCTNTNNAVAGWIIGRNPNDYTTLNDTNPQLGTAANASVAGALPATLGALTGAAVPPLYCKMEG